MPRAVTAFLHEGLVEFPAGTRMNSSPAIFTVILQTGNVSTEKWSKLSPATGPLTFITQLIIQDIWLNFHLQAKDSRVYIFQTLNQTHFSIGVHFYTTELTCVTCPIEKMLHLKLTQAFPSTLYIFGLLKKHLSKEKKYFIRNYKVKLEVLR